MDLSQLSKHSLSRLIAESLDVKLGSVEFYNILAASLRYIVRVDNAYAYQRSLKQLVDFPTLGTSAQKFRLKLGGYKSCSLSLRYLVLNLIRMRKATGDDAKVLGKELNLPWSDTYFTYQLLRNDGEFRNSLRTPDIMNLPRETFKLEAYKNLNDLFGEIYVPVMKYIKHITFSKLRFISSSTNTEFSDLHSDLLVNAIQAFHKLMPCDMSTKHIINYVNRSVHNHALNMIYTATADKRSRLVKGSTDGFNVDFQLMCVSENQLNLRTTGDDSIGYEDAMSSEYSQALAEKQEGELVVEQLLLRYSGKPKKHSLLSILTGTYHPEFTTWLQDARILRATTSDNVDAQEQCTPETFLAHVCTFLNINLKSAEEFLDSIGTTLQPQGV